MSLSATSTCPELTVTRAVGAHEYMPQHVAAGRRLKKVPIILQGGILMFACYQLLTRAYKGVAVAQLPFEPIPLIRMISHRGLPEDSSPKLVSVVIPLKTRAML
jgi:hypothetical protein